MTVSDRLTALMDAVRKASGTTKRLSFVEATNIINIFPIPCITSNGGTRINDLKTTAIYVGKGINFTGKPTAMNADYTCFVFVFSPTPTSSIQTFWGDRVIWQRQLNNGNWSEWKKVSP